MCEELAEAASSVEELLLARVWNSSLAKFAQWEAGEGDLQGIVDEVDQLQSATSEDWTGGLPKYMARCCRVGVGIPFDLDKIPNLKDSQNVVLELGPSGLSLPTRDYYFEDNFAEQRKWFEEHLKRIGEMCSFEDDFGERVQRFERKLALIQMKPAQSRNYDQYFSVSTLDGMIEDINSLNHLADKLDNYSEDSVSEEDPDRACLTQKDWQLTGEAATSMEHFLSTFYGELSLKQVLSDNYATSYTSKGVFPVDPETAEHRMLVFDGDYFRRVFALICGSAGERNKADILAYLKYKIVRSKAEYCTKALDDEMFNFYSRQLGGQKEQKSAEKRTVGRVNSWVGELLGKAYVQRFFSEEDKETIKGMIGDVLEVALRSAADCSGLDAGHEVLTPNKRLAHRGNQATCSPKAGQVQHEDRIP